MKNKRKELKVIYKGDEVGTLALTKYGRAAFQYNDAWINNGFSISPFSLPLTKEVFIPGNPYLEGLFGVFYDSLPDSWGRLVVDRMLRSKGIELSQINILDRLAIVGSNGMGALEYVPKYDYVTEQNTVSLDELAVLCNKIMQSAGLDNLDALFTVAGSSGGARPKANINIDGEEWLVKFQYSLDQPNSGKMEFEYSELTKECGINVPKAKLFPSKSSSGYFGSKRFDRPKIHMISAAGLLDVNFATAVFDYKDLLKLTNIITNGNTKEIKEMYVRMCFNIIFTNHDDHMKNFAYLYDDVSGILHISPAFDLAYSKTAFNEQTTTVNGKGRDITDEDMVMLGILSGLKKSFCVDSLEKVKEVKANYEKKKL